MFLHHRQAGWLRVSCGACDLEQKYSSQMIPKYILYVYSSQSHCQLMIHPFHKGHQRENFISLIYEILEQMEKDNVDFIALDM